MAATTWGIGDYPRMAARLAPAAEAVVAAAELRGGESVLDVACGTGTAAVLAAARGGGTAQVVGVDLEPALLALAPRDAGVAWVEGDAAALPFVDDAFDVTLSVFGVMYAPDHARAAAELARVTRSRAVLASWIPGSFLPSMGGAVAPFLAPPPPGGAPPARWGDADYATTLLRAAGFGSVAHHDASLTLDFATPDAAVAFLIDTAGHVLAERPALQASGRWDDLRTALADLVAGATKLPCDYRLTVAHFDAR